MLDIAMRPAASMTSVSPQPSQEMTDGVSFADELALMDATIPSPRSNTIMNHDVAKLADMAANGTACITLPGGGPESLTMDVEAMSSMSKQSFQEPGLRVMTPRRTVDTGHTKSARASKVDHLDRSPQSGVLPVEANASDGARSVTTMLKLMDEVSRSKSSDFPLLLTQLAPSTPSSLDASGVDDAPRGHASLLSRAGDDGLLQPLMMRRPAAAPARMERTHSEHKHVSIHATGELIRGVEQKAFTERLTELSMMVADLRNEDDSQRFKNLSSELSSVFTEVVPREPLNSTPFESIGSQWRIAPSDSMNPDSSLEARDQEHGDSGYAGASSSDASALETTYSMMSPMMPHQPAMRVVDLEPVHHVPEPLRMTVEHLRSLLPEGGRLLEVQPHLVRLEVVDASGPLQLEVVMRSGVVDVRAHGVAAAEMAWRVPELAAALQGSGMRLGTFDVQPTRRGRESSSSDRGHTDHRQDLDDTSEESVRNVSTAGRRVSR